MGGACDGLGEWGYGRRDVVTHAKWGFSVRSDRAAQDVATQGRDMVGRVRMWRSRVATCSLLIAEQRWDLVRVTPPSSAQEAGDISQVI